MNSSYFTTPITRKEYWIRILISWIAVGVITALVQGGGDPGTITTIIGLLGWAYWIILQTKRLRDANRSFLWLLLDLLTIVGIIVIGCFGSDPAGRYYR